MALSVKLQVFEGPLDLLLHLIEKNKIDIYNIPIVLVTDQYMAYIRQMQTEDMNVMSEFLVMAATLIDIKCKMLLPRDETEEGEEEDHALAAVQQPAEEAAALPGEAVRAEDLDQKAQAVTQDHAAQHRVEGQDEEGRNDRHPANEGILFAQGRIRAACAFAGLSAQSKLAQHPHDAHQGDQDEVEDEEGKAAGLAHFIGEGPEVAQANGRADGRHEEAEAAPPLTTFGCLHSEFLSP